MTVDVGAAADELVHEVRPDEAESAGDDAARAGERGYGRRLVLHMTAHSTAAPIAPADTG